MNEITKYLGDPLILGIAAAVVILLLLVLAWVILRGRKNGEMSEDQIRAKLASMDQESQFSSIANRVGFQDSPEKVASGIADVCKEYLSLPIFKIYAGQDSDAELTNVLPKPESAAVTNDLEQSAALPPSISAPLSRGYTRAQAININALIGPAATGTGQGVTVIPWNGAFGWSGLIVAGAMNSNPGDTLAPYHTELASLSNKLAVALEMATSKSASQVDPQQQVNTERFYQAILRALDGQSSFQEIIQLTTGLVGSESAALWMLDANTQMLVLEVSHGLKAAEFLPLPMGQGLAGNVLETTTPLALADAPSDPRCIFPREFRESGVGSYLGVPVIVNGNPAGVLEVHTRESRYWTDSEVATLEAAAEAVASVLKNQMPSGRNLKIESAYLALAESLQSLRTPDELMEAAVEVFGNALGVSRAVILDLDDSKRPVTIRHEFRAPDAQSALGASFTDNAARQIEASTKDGVPIVAGDLGVRSLLGDEAAGKFTVVSELAVPVRENGRTRAVVLLQQCDRVRIWHPDELEFIGRVGRQLALSLEHFKPATSDRVEPSPAPEVDRSHGLLNALPEAVIGLDKEGRLTFFNQAAFTWLGLKQEDLGKAVNTIHVLTMTDGTIWNRILSTTIVSRYEVTLKLPAPAVQPLSHSLLHGDEDGQPVSLAVAPVRDNAGASRGFLVVLADIAHVPNMAGDITSRIARLKEQQAEIEHNIAEAKATELQARARIEKLNALEGGSLSKRAEEDLAVSRAEKVQLQNSLQQMLDTNKLKSEFIVNCGREIEASVQSTIGVAELLDNGSYGALEPHQKEAVREILNFGNRIKGDIASLIEYGAARIR